MNWKITAQIPRVFLLSLKTAYLCLMVALIQGNVAFAAIDNARFQKLEVADSLSNQNINVIFQDSTGFIWFGTQEGLNRYDGYRIETFNQIFGDKTSLSSSWINAIVEDNNNKLWVGTRSGVNRYDPNTRRFEQFNTSEDGQGINDEVVRDVWKDSKGVIWVATRKGLNKFIENENRFKHYNFANDEGESIEAYDVVMDLTGAFWLGSEKNGLFRFDGESERLVKVVPQFYVDGKLKTVRIRSLFIDSHHKLWIGTNSAGVYRLDFTAQKSENMEEAVVKIPGITQTSVIDIIEDDNGTIWFASSDGLVYYSNGKVDAMVSSDTNKFSISDNMVISIMIDRSGVFWVGSFKGVDKWNISTTQFDQYSLYAPEGKRLSGNNITLVNALQDGRHLVGSYQGLDFIDPETGDVESFRADQSNPNSLKSNSVMSAKQASDGKLWLGYRGSGLSYYDLENKTFTHFKADTSNPNALQSNGITAIKEASDGTLWISAFEGGISKFHPEQQNFTTFKHDPTDLYSISSDRVMSIYESSDGLLWLGTWDNGVSILNPNTETVFRIQSEPDNPGGLSSNSVWSVLEDSNHNIWIGTQGGGLNLLSKEDRDAANIRFTRITQQEGLPSNVVYGILEDDSGMLWLSTNRGLTRLDPQTMKIKNFTQAQGLQSSEFNSGAYHKTDSGMLMFGGPSGVTTFMPSEIQPSTHKPKTVITSFNRLNTQLYIPDVINEQNQIEITHIDYLIGFEFAGLDFTSPKDNRYRYRLIGFDDNWIDSRESRTATYTNLPGGRYTFEVMSANSDGVWNEDSAKISLIVHPAPWFSPYAYALYAVLIILFIYSLYRYYQNKMHAQSLYRESLELEVSNRTQELSQANEQLHRASITDQLTGLFNRRYLFDVIEDKFKEVYEKFTNAIELQSARHHSGPRLFFLMFDLDGFKPINDTYGHDAGDKMIQQVAHLLNEVCRMTDTVIRWGGDEFVVIGEIDDESEVTALADAIRKTIMKHGFDIGLAQRMHLSCSIGFSLYPFSHHSPDSVSWEQVHLLADKALYMSKDNGRNTWSGIVQAEHSVPFSTMNALNQKLEAAISSSDVRVLRHESE
ncbi:two-component regulator propeller domain-containing protein [Glaciecola sp. SC05]|uniref:ligand-binding sensor domain-containing diguanylate cyclase n=1 Tax=Glaciecola sp. SC05 TaxID=1987355 RepID=UPI0035274C47